MSGYFTNRKDEQSIERLMRERPQPEARKKQGKVMIRRCINCSAYDKETAKCRLPTCPHGQEQRDECRGCPYRKGICNICYKKIVSGK